jgi:hypothetical protein
LFGAIDRTPGGRNDHQRNVGEISPDGIISILARVTGIIPVIFVEYTNHRRFAEDGLVILAAYGRDGKGIPVTGLMIVSIDLSVARFQA